MAHSWGTAHWESGTMNAMMPSPSMIESMHVCIENLRCIFENAKQALEILRSLDEANHGNELGLVFSHFAWRLTDCHQPLSFDSCLEVRSLSLEDHSDREGRPVQHLIHPRSGQRSLQCHWHRSTAHQWSPPVLGVHNGLHIEPNCTISVVGQCPTKPSLIIVVPV